MHITRWAHMHHFLSVCLSVCLSAFFSLLSDKSGRQGQSTAFYFRWVFDPSFRVATIRENQGKFGPSGKSGKVREFKYFLSRVRESQGK